MFNSEKCCETKDVGGVSYTLVGRMDTAAFNCLNDCIYKKTEEAGGKFCFAAGELKVDCTGGTGELQPGLGDNSGSPPLGPAEGSGGPQPEHGEGSEGPGSGNASEGPEEGSGGPQHGSGQSAGEL